MKGFFFFVIVLVAALALHHNEGFRGLFWLAMIGLFVVSFLCGFRLAHIQGAAEPATTLQKAGSYLFSTSCFLFVVGFAEIIISIVFTPSPHGCFMGVGC